MLPTVAEASNLSAAYAAVLGQARLVHKDLSGDMGPTLEPASHSSGQVDAGGAGVAPRMAWVAGSADHGSMGMSVPLPVASARAPAALAAPPGAVGPLVSHGGHAGVVMGGPAPTPAEAAGHDMRHAPGRPPGAWSGRALRRFSPPLALAGRNVSALRGAPRWRRLLLLPQLRPRPGFVSAPMTTCRMLSPMPMPGFPLPRARRAPGAGAPLVSCGSRLLWRQPSCASPSMRVVPLLTWKPPGQMQTPLRPLLMPHLHAAPVTAPVMPLPRDIKPIYKAPPPEAMAPPQAAKAPPPAAAGAAASSAGLAAESDAHAGDDAAAPMAPGGAAVSPGDAAAILVPEPARAPAARRPAKGGKGGNEGNGDEVQARRSFLESAFSQADAGATLDGRGLAAPGYSGDADDSAGSGI